MILVFGASGQLGQELVRAAALQVKPLRTLSHAEIDIAKSSDVASVLKHTKPHLVVNAAAYAKVDLAAANIEGARRTNEVGTAKLASACTSAPIRTANCPTAARRPANSQVDCRLFAKAFGFSGRHWTAGVDATAEALMKSSPRTANVA